MWLTVLLAGELNVPDYLQYKDLSAFASFNSKDICFLHLSCCLLNIPLLVIRITVMWELALTCGNKAMLLNQDGHLHNIEAQNRTRHG